MSRLRRGIDPALLLSQIKNTMPYLFDEAPVGPAAALVAGFPPAQLARAGVTDGLSHFEYFKLCLCAHYLTVATPVPTDVDNQIRQKLWPAELPLEMALEMAAYVLESRGWDFSLVTARSATGAAGTPWERERISGHQGEWFTVASGAYCALGQYAGAAAAAEQRARLLEAIADEVDRHSEIFGSLWRAKDGLGSLRASAVIAHNFGDLDRAMDMWELSPADPLRIRFYKLAANPYDPDKKLRYLGRLWVAGELYKTEIDGSSMALENHRHFALRKPRALRQSPALMIQTGPFLDAWGRQVAEALKAGDGTPSADTVEVAEALEYGWSRLPKTVGYGRALKGMLEVHPELKLSVKNRTLGVERRRFETLWAERALAEIEEIPSRA